MKIFEHRKVNDHVEVHLERLQYEGLRKWHCLTLVKTRLHTLLVALKVLMLQIPIVIAKKKVIHVK